MVKKTPRWYQQEAYDALIKTCFKPNPSIKPSITGFEIPYANMCTGSGKALLIAMLMNKCLNQGGRCIQLMRTKELVEQNFDEAYHYVDRPDLLGIVCSQLGKQQYQRHGIVAMAQSIYKYRHKLEKINLLVIDECDEVSPFVEDETKKTQYQKIIEALVKKNPQIKIMGMTASPYRDDQGMIHDDCLKGKALFTQQCYETPIPRMIKEGFLSHVESISGDVEIDKEGLPIAGKDYSTKISGVKFNAILPDAIKDMKAKFHHYGIKTAIIYASTIENARKIVKEWDDDSEIRLSTGDMKHERKENITWFKNDINDNGGNRFLVNVGLYIRGFNYPNLSCVVFFIATKVRRKYVQICGRVIRAHDDKNVGYVLDYGGNLDEHGPIDATKPVKKRNKKGEKPMKYCLECNTENRLSARYCINPECKAEFVPSEDGNYSMRTKAQALAMRIADATEEFNVAGVVFSKHYGRKKPIPMIKMMFYDESYNGIPELIHTEYLMLEHPGFPSDKAKRFIMKLFKKAEDYYELGKEGVNVDNMIILLNEHYDTFFRKIIKITVAPDSNMKYKNIVKMQFGE